MKEHSPVAIQLEFSTDQIAILRIDQPGSRVNILTAEVWTELQLNIRILQARTEIRGLVIFSSKPGIFIAGADLKLFANSAPSNPSIEEYVRSGNETLYLLESLPFPTCAVVDGAALGGGFEVALACDQIFCGENPKLQLGLPEVKLGIIPGWGGSQRLIRMMPFADAVELLTTGSSITRNDPQLLNMITKPCESGGDPVAFASKQLLEGQSNWIESRRRKKEPLAGISPIREATSLDSESVRIVLEVIRAGASLGLREAIAIETEAFMKLVCTEHAQKQIAAFFASRQK